MITDQETDFLFLSDLIKLRPSFWRNLELTLRTHQIEYDFLPFTNDIWAVDYMPIQLDKNIFIQFVYKPDYLQNAKYIATQTDPAQVCNTLTIYPRQCPIILDGGNVIKGSNWVIVTDKLFKENRHMNRSLLLKQLENLFSKEIVIIPAEPYDFTGHADGIVRYYNSDTVLINHYHEKHHKSFQKKLISALRPAGISAIEIEYHPYNNADSTSASGYYINFLQMKDFILMPTFQLKEDERALRQFEDLFPNHAIDTIDTRDISNDGGVLNCITWNIKI